MKSFVRTTVAILCVLLLPYASSLALAEPLSQDLPRYPQQSQPPPRLLGPDQLDNLVAPIALYPDPLLSQALAASTYPLEIVEAQQWLQLNRNLQDQQLIEAAKQQDWDPSVQVLVAFPDAMALFNRDIRWTNDLGNAFLAQQADVMDAIQRLRVRASNNGRLANTPQQIVTTETQDRQSAIQIQPANPQVLYPPVYNPAYVWGPPASGAYPALPYPQDQYGSGYASGYGSGSGYGFGNGINLLGLFSGLIGGFGGWGWALNWFTHVLSLAGSFFSNFGFNNYSGGFSSGGGYGAPVIWAHDPAHRLGVPYSHGFSSGQNRRGNFDARMSSSRLSGSRFAQSGLASSGRPASAGYSASDGWRSFGNSARTSTPSASPVRGGLQSDNNQRAESYNRAPGPASRLGYASNMGASPQNRGNYSTGRPQQMASNFRNTAQTTRALSQDSRFAAPPASQNFSSRAPPQHFSQPRNSSSHVSAPHFSAPHGSSHVSAPRHSGGGGHPSKGSGKGSGKGSHKH